MREGNFPLLFYMSKQLKRKKGGDLPPNRDEEWLDVQARALGQAYWMIKSICKRGGVLV